MRSACGRVASAGDRPASAVLLHMQRAAAAASPPSLVRSATASSSLPSTAPPCSYAHTHSTQWKQTAARLLWHYQQPQAHFLKSATASFS